MLYSIGIHARSVMKRQCPDGLVSSSPQVHKRSAGFDAASIASLHREYFPVIYRYMNYRLGDLGAAEDLTSQTFLLLLEAIAKGNGPKTSVRGWLMGTASNLVNGYYRRIYQRPTEQLPESLISQEHDPLHAAALAESKANVRAAVKQLTEQQQHVLALRFGSGFSLSETAEAMDKNVNAVKALQYRALESIRRILRDEAS